MHCQAQCEIMHDELNQANAPYPGNPIPGSSLASASDDEYLKSVGVRVREARARRGMSRRILSRDSRVSERYLAQLEAGRGNISILLLRQIAQALDLGAAALLRDEVGHQSEELLRTTAFLAALPADKIQ